ELTIGRDPSNVMCLADLLLSRRHCVITITPVPRVRDVGSSNGTFVNGMQITDHPLSDGDRLQVGESVFVFVAKALRRGDMPVTLTREEPGPSTTKLRLDHARYLHGVLTREAPATLCVPIARRNRVLGIIYLASRQPDAFDDEHLELVAGIAGVAATALENARRVAWLESETERLHSALVVEHTLVGR